MVRFLVRRVLGALVILLLISMITYFLFFFLPADPALLSCGKQCDPQNVALIRKNLGLDTADMDAVLALHGRHIRRPAHADR